MFVLQEGLGTKCSPQRHNEFKHHGVVLELVVLIPFLSGSGAASGGPEPLR